MRYIGTGVAILLVLVLPNLIWFATSTVRIHNASTAAIPSVGYLACETTFKLGRLQPGQSRLRFLPACGDDTLEILVGDTGHCQSYVEGELYHVDAVLGDGGAVACAYDDLFSALLVTKFW